MTERYHGLDALRAGAMVLGIVVHAMLPFTEPSILAQEAPGTEAPPFGLHWNVLLIWIHQWRMPVFFLLAGFFAAMVIERRGPAFFLKDRSLRIGGTLVACLIALTPVLKPNVGDLHHFWFLWFLLQFCALAVIGAWLGLDRLFSPVSWVFGKPWRMLLLCIPMVPLVIFTKQDLFGQIIPEHISEVRWQGLVYYAFFFFLGMALWARKDALTFLGRARAWGGLLAVSTLVTGVVTFLSLRDSEADWLLVPLIAAGQLALIFGLVGLAHGVVRQTGPVLRFLVESAYAVYIVHLYVVVGIAIELIKLGLPTNGAIPLSVLLTVPVSLLLYVIFVRYSPLDWLLAGPRKARFKWPGAVSHRRSE